MVTVRCWTMVSGMKLISVLLAFLPALCNAVEQMVVLQAPEYVKFRSGEDVKLSQTPDILSALWGFTTSQDQNWSGLEAGNPFKKPEGIVLIEIQGFRTLQLDSIGKQFPLETDIEPGYPYQLAADRVYARFAGKKPYLMEIVDDDSIFSVKSQYSSLLKNLPAKSNELEDAVLGEKSIGPCDKLESINCSLTPDLKAMMDLQLVIETARIIQEKASVVHDGVPDLYWFRIPGIEELMAVYGSGSKQVQEASKIMMKTIEETQKMFKEAYDGNVVVIALGVDYQTANIVRVRRNLLQATEKPDADNKYNLAPGFYNENYSAIFNIIFLTMLIFALAVFGIALGMWHIDPGKDNIVYRMTAQRLKKDQ